MRAALLICFVVFSSFVRAQTGELRGVVVDRSTQQPVAYAKVIVCTTNLVAQTDSSGEFRISNVPTGTYSVTTLSTGYRRDTLPDVQIFQDRYTALRIELRFPPPCDWNAITIPPFNKKHAIIIGSIQSVLVAGSLIGLNELWYKQYPREPFHSFNDNGEWLQMDKIGHMQSAYSIGLISTRLWNLSHMNPRKAAWIGGLTGFSYLTAIEIMDGYSSGWGFSSGDMIANVAGTALFMSQELTWGEQRIQPKFGFRRSGYAPYRPELLGTSYVEQMIKDYNGQTYWLSVNVASFLSDQTRFPQWLNVAFGYGANGMTGGHQNPLMTNAQGNEITLNRYRQYYLALDIDLRKLPVKSRFLRVVFATLSFIKIPLPGIELSQNGVRPLVFAF